MRLPLVAVFACLPACSHNAPAAPPATASAPTLFVDHVEGSGRPVILVGDLGAPVEMWSSTVKHLSGRAETHVLDIAGFAGNAPGAAPLLPQLGVEVARWIAQKGWRDAVIVGHLFGASVAWQVAMEHPDLLGGIVVVDTPPSRNTGDPGETAEADEVRAALAAATPERFAQMTARRIASGMKDEARARVLVEKASRSDPRVVADAFHAMMTTDNRPRIAAVRTRVLVLLTTGNLPPGAAPEVEAAFREQLKPIAGHQLVLVEGSRHYVMDDAPEAFFANLDRFLAVR